MKKLFTFVVLASACLATVGVYHLWFKQEPQITFHYGVTSVICYQDAVYIQDPVYGNHMITEPILVELISHPVMTRLLWLEQHGAYHYIEEDYSYTRYQHSLNVMLLVRRAGGSLEEQVAALLHDASHTICSHSTGYLFETDYLKADSHQDAIHKKYLEDCGLSKTLERYGLNIDDVMPDRDEFKRLERDLPDLCADRISYNLDTITILRGETLAKRVIDALMYEEGHGWFFTDESAAEIFANHSAWMTKNVWSSPANAILNILFSDLLRIALEKGILDMDDVHFSTDRAVWKILKESSIPEIQLGIDRMNNWREFLAQDLNSVSRWVPSKSRVVDPYVKLDDTTYTRLSEINHNHKIEMQDTSAKMRRGHALVGL